MEATLAQERRRRYEALPNRVAVHTLVLDDNFAGCIRPWVMFCGNGIQWPTTTVGLRVAHDSHLRKCAAGKAGHSPARLTFLWELHHAVKLVHLTLMSLGLCACGVYLGLYTCDRGIRARKPVLPLQAVISRRSPCTAEPAEQNIPGRS